MKNMHTVQLISKKKRKEKSVVISLKNPVFCPPNCQNLKHHFWKKKMDANRMDYEEKSIKKNKNNNEKLVIFV